MKLMSIVKMFAAASVSLVLSAGIAHARDREGLSDFFDFVGDVIEAGRGDSHGSEHVRGRVVKTVDIKADKLGSRTETVHVGQAVSYIRLTALKNRVDIRSDLEVIGDHRWPMTYRMHDLREGESRVIRLQQGFFDGFGGNSNSPTYVDLIRLEVESPNLIGNRGVLRIEFIR